MKKGYSKEYQRPCVIIDSKDNVFDVLLLAECWDAIFWEGSRPGEGKTFVVQLQDKQPELYTEEALLQKYL